VDDLTLVGYWMPLLLEIYQPRTLIHPGTYGTLGYSLPAAIGAKLACPKQPFPPTRLTQIKQRPVFT
jgi:thiamine pyrophosphate-dependent acetolactate synthase large subunit-like protein